jgi:BMFP domain-containing protein YqiC
MNEKIIEGLSQKFSALASNLPKGSELPGQEQLKHILQNTLSKLDLVTREEFDAQAAVLMRTREKVDALESRMSEIETMINK